MLIKTQRCVPRTGEGEGAVGRLQKAQRIMSYEEDGEVGGRPEEDEEDDERREAAIASTQSLQPNFRPKRVSQDQVSKLQELHKRRLLIKSKTSKKPKGRTAGKSHYKDLEDGSYKDLARSIADSGVPDLKTSADNVDLSVSQHKVATNHVPKKHKKLHWGLETKERWERKANM